MSGPSRTARGRTERGAAAVLATVVAVLLVALTGVASALTGLLVADRRVAAAADLAALAGAGAIQQAGDPCAAANRVAAANHARLRSCRVRGEEVVVEATAEVSLLGRTVRVPARARAGPDPGSSTHQPVEEQRTAVLVEGVVAVPALG